MGREQNMTATASIHFAMIRDFVICNYTEIYISTPTSFFVVHNFFSCSVCHQNKAERLREVFFSHNFLLRNGKRAEREGAHERTKHTEKKLGDMQLMWWRWFFGTHNSDEGRKMFEAIVSCVKHFFSRFRGRFLFTKLFYIANKTKHNFFLYSTLFNPHG